MPSTSTSGTQIVPGMKDVYSQLLNLNQQNYGNVLNSYSQGAQNLNAQLPGLYGNYDKLQSGVMNTLGLGGGGWGVAQPAVDEIKRSYAAQSGQTQQRLISAGLGNSTVLASANRGLEHDAAKAYGALGAQLAQTAAGYQAQFGMARQQAQMQGLGMQTGLYQNLGGQLAGYHFANTAGNMLGGYSSHYDTAGAGGGGYGGGGGHGAYSSPLDNVMFPAGNADPFAPPSASAYTGGAGAGYTGYGAYQQPVPPAAGPQAPDPGSPLGAGLGSVGVGQYLGGGSPLAAGLGSLGVGPYFGGGEDSFYSGY